VTRETPSRAQLSHHGPVGPEKSTKSGEFLERRERPNHVESGCPRRGEPTLMLTDAQKGRSKIGHSIEQSAPGL
jgi:hypothetical protein